MTQGDIAILLETRLQTIGYFLSENLEPEEVNLSLDAGTSDFIDEVISGLRKVEIDGGSFESNSVRLDELRTLKETSPELDPVTGSPADQVWFDLPSDYRDYIRVSPKVNADCFASPTYKKARVINSEDLEELLEDTYHGSIPYSPIVEIEGSRIIVNLNNNTSFFEGSFTVPNLKIQYIKEPPKFDVANEEDTEFPLPSKAIYRIIDRTVLTLAPILEKLQQQAASVGANKLT